MKKSEYVPINEIMVRKNGKKYMVVPSVGCIACAFKGKTPYWCESMICNSDARSDRTNVVFIRRKDLEDRQPTS